MFRLFGAAKQAPSPSDTIKRLRETVETLEKRETYLQKKIQKEIEFARANASKNRRAALLALKRKKLYEQQIEKIEGTRMTIETQVLAIEETSVNVEAMRAIREGASTMRNLHQSMTIDDVDNTMDEIQEQMDIATEISTAISQPLGATAYDDADIEAELAELEEQNLDEQLLETPVVSSKAPATRAPSVAVTTASMPSIPSRPIETDEDRELAELEASMAM
eukprot:TRINITY_DN482_c0_g1_i1.p1 TRINITY_DN482_c0_g1~~TRINITY_DN482_c0_g1_i1.p1  ORF type:complete len:222 (-),score=66.96 TRINITY_DN482_c0_g1_i1:91-756(-)